MIEITFMKRAIKLAKRGAGSVSPNPMVGAVLVNDDQIIGEGCHERFGGPHAEVCAIHNAHSSPRGSTLYVNLEPCSIFGKTPPCTEAIMKAGVSRVVVAMKDPNPRVNGQGLSILRHHGIEVKTGVCEREAWELNRFFITFMKYHRPYVTLKLALSLDGWLAESSGNAKWLTSSRSRQWVHQKRSEYDAVLVGVETVVKDNPSLTTHGQGRNPWRLVLDPGLRTPATSQIVRSNADGKTWLLCRENVRHRKKVRTSPILSTDTQKNVPLLLNYLADEGITSVWIEGGARTFSCFLKSGLIDEMNVFYAPKFLGSGLNPIQDIFSLDEKWPLELVRTRSFGNDVLHCYRWIR